MDQNTWEEIEPMDNNQTYKDDRDQIVRCITILDFHERRLAILEEEIKRQTKEKVEERRFITNKQLAIASLIVTIGSTILGWLLNHFLQ